jgi:lipid-A-disaccharide synthase
MAGREVILTSNGPGELYTWVGPVMRAWRAREPSARISIVLLPCQGASGREPEVARGMQPDHVVSAPDFRQAMLRGRAPEGLRGGEGGVVISLGGNLFFAQQLARRLGVPSFAYSFLPEIGHGQVRLFVPEGVRRPRRLPLPQIRRNAPLEAVGNLVADAVEATEPIANPGEPHVLLMAGSRHRFTIGLIPLILAVADRLVQRYPRARFVWPVPRLLPEATLQAGIAGVDSFLGGIRGERRGDCVYTPNGAVVEMVAEHDRYAHMRSADIALTIPGTNTLELGIATVPTVVVLPLQRAEVIHLDNALHFLFPVLPFGMRIKRWAIRTAAPRLRQPFSLPNRFSGEDLMHELVGDLTADDAYAAVAELLANGERRAWVRERLRETMPAPGAAARLVERVHELLARPERT